MPKFQVRNSKTRMILGDVIVADPKKVLSTLAEETGTTIEEIAHSLGSTVEEAKATLQIVEVLEESWKQLAVRKKAVPALPPRRLFG